tara:strand:- start:6266 stop:6649 length:384 start_codon:yes stop_codon:yes gene_type:complete
MATINYDAYQVTRETFRALRDDVIVEEMAFKERKLQSGIILLDDDGKGHGIRPRWGKVYAIGPEQTEVTVGQWIMVAHGRWTRGVKIQDGNSETVIRKVDNKDILLVSDDDPDTDDTLADAIDIYQR